MTQKLCLNERRKKGRKKYRKSCGNKRYNQIPYLQIYLRIEVGKREKEKNEKERKKTLFIPLLDSYLKIK